MQSDVDVPQAELIGPSALLNPHSSVADARMSLVGNPISVFLLFRPSVSLVPFIVLHLLLLFLVVLHIYSYYIASECTLAALILGVLLLLYSI